MGFVSALLGAISLTLIVIAAGTPEDLRSLGGTLVHSIGASRQRAMSQA
ncbi:MAG: hypothetical protein ABIS18_06240 [Actinomycetota bacterium]